MLIDLKKQETYYLYCINGTNKENTKQLNLSDLTFT